MAARAPLVVLPALLTSLANRRRARDRAGDEEVKAGTCVLLAIVLPLLGVLGSAGAGIVVGAGPSGTPPARALMAAYTGLQLLAIVAASRPRAWAARGVPVHPGVLSAARGALFVALAVGVVASERVHGVLVRAVFVLFVCLVLPVQCACDATPPDRR